MNDTTVIGAAGQVEDVRAYVQAVRAWLGDLPPDEVEDLTAGMEADLAERAAESGGPLGGLLGEPEAYAAELRSAAGLPPRVDVVVPDAVRAEPWTGRLAREAHEVVARHPWLRELRPTWWLARGAVAGWVVAEVLGTGRVVLLPLLGAALSMWLGLVLCRREPLGTGPRVALGAGNALAVVLLLPMLAFYTAGSGDFTDVSGPALPPAGISADGGQITNVFAYDAAGRRLTDVRLYDQYGHPLAVSPDAVPMPGGPDGQGPDPASWPPDPRVMSVFPLRLSATGDPWTSTEGEWAPPVVIAPLAATATSSATPSPSPSGSPSAGPASSASPSPSVSSTP